MSGKGNRGFGAALADEIAADQTQENISPARSIMSSRSEALNRIATGKVVTDRTEFVDPERCRPWHLHNRDIDHLTSESCNELIEAFKSAGRQRIPAIVRRLRDDPDHDFEIIAGVRRWWTVKYLRAHHHPEFDYLVTVQNLTDEEAFRVSDIENRARKDLSDLERARDYLRALDQFYDGSQSAMAERLNVSKSWMSRILEVGRLPDEIIKAFADSHQITARYAGQIAPQLRDENVRDRVIAEAQEITTEREEGGDPLPAVDTVRRLLKAATTKPARNLKRSAEVTSATGKPMIKYTASGRGGGLTIKILPKSGAKSEEIMKAIEKLVAELAP